MTLQQAETPPRQLSRRELIVSTAAVGSVATTLFEPQDTQAQDIRKIPDPAKKRDWWDKEFRTLVEGLVKKEDEEIPLYSFSV